LWLNVGKPGFHRPAASIHRKRIVMAGLVPAITRAANLTPAAKRVAVASEREARPNILRHASSRYRIEGAAQRFDDHRIGGYQ
jgi:hypothetical protein